MKYLLCVTCAILLFGSCCKDEPEPEPKQANRTVLIYIAGENSLSSFIDIELQEMREGSMAIGNENLILYVDAADSEVPPYLIRYKDGLGIDSVSMNEGLTSDPDILYNVVRTAFDKYPANEYGLVLWGHASGWAINKDSLDYNTPVVGVRAKSRPRKAYGIDNGKNTTKDTGKWINLPTLSKVLLSTGRKLKFIFADCCQFQCIESAYELRKTCDYIIASAAEIPGVGAPYDTMVPAMFSQSATFYQQMVDAYYAQTVYGYKEPLSVIKTSELDKLATATATVLKSFARKLTSIDNPYPDMRGIIYYQGSNYGSYHYMYDMNDFILQYATQEDYNTWKQMFDQAVVYKTPTLELDGKWMTNINNDIDFKSFSLDDRHYGGVSMFVPQYPNAYYSSYNTEIKKLAWYYAASLADLNW